MVTENRQIQVRRDTSANWSSSNPTLAAGEPGFDTTLEKLKVGDGSTAWNSHPFIGADSVIVGSDTFANRPGSGTNVGDLYEATDNGVVYRWDGSSWDVFSNTGSMALFTPPPSSGWTAFNSGSVTAEKDTRLMSFAAATLDMRGEFRTSSISTNYTATFYIDTTTFPILNYVSGGIVLKAAAGNSIIHYGYQTDTGLGTSSQLGCTLWSNYTTFSAHYLRANQYNLPQGSVPKWLRVRDNATTRYYEFSYNGADWLTFFSHTRTTGVTPDQIGWGLGADDAGGAFTATSRLRSFAII